VINSKSNNLKRTGLAGGRSLPMTDVQAPPSGNQLLASLPPVDRHALEADMHLERGRRGQPIPQDDEAVWFPNDGIVSLLATDEDGHSAQTGIVGPEGCVGLGTLLDEAAPLADAAVQIEGTFSVIPARRLRQMLRNRPVIRNAMVRYLYQLTAQSLRVGACNRLHSLDRRCCTWLLMMQDRTRLNALPMTQDGLVTVLGGGRPRVNRTLGMLERMGLVARRRGKILLLDRPGLEQHACDCYRSVFKL
jgi:CRP-like cAMP-binding protein